MLRYGHTPVSTYATLLYHKPPLSIQQIHALGRSQGLPTTRLRAAIIFLPSVVSACGMRPRIAIIWRLVSKSARWSSSSLGSSLLGVPVGI